MGRDRDCMYLWHNLEMRGEELEGGVYLYVVVVKVDDRGGDDVVREDVGPVKSYRRSLRNGVVEEGHL